ncbi:arabinofuranosidase/xylosidase homolog [Prunus yedoensis var. nudiflora]|uniref:Arabinofuranosidase/xylosidase homolog n=1 Tax=Prunus yedoensis var. nudiflora TaxID=2094558 RepID=A0A314XZU7_PRUYE|nr:arabinofuranosidase/xylosidase homolog [Prunus yedoensis var. nudiflora]
MDGTHTLLVFTSPPDGKWAASKQLVGFHKIHIAAGSERRVRIAVHVCKHLSVVDRFGIRRIPLGEHKLQIGDLSHQVSLQANLGEIKFAPPQGELKMADCNRGEDYFSAQDHEVPCS